MRIEPLISKYHGFKSLVMANSPKLKKKTIIVIFSGLIIYGTSVRFLGIGFGLPYLHHWDEPQAASTALRILKTGDYNPHNFHWAGFTAVSTDVRNFRAII